MLSHFHQLHRTTLICLVLTLCVIGSTAFVVPVAATYNTSTTNQFTDGSALEIEDITLPSKVEAGEPVDIQFSVVLPTVPFSEWSAEGELNLYVNGQQEATQEFIMQDGDSLDVSFTHLFQTEGTNEVQIGVEATLEGPRGESINIDRATEPVSTDVTPHTVTTSGTAFATPEQLEDDITSLRGQFSEATGMSAFVLATDDELSVVFTSDQPEEGFVSVHATEFGDYDLEHNGLNFSVLLADSVQQHDPNQRTFENISDNPHAYDGEFVSLSAYHRSTAVNHEQSGVSTSVGTLVSEPSSEEQIRSPGRQSREILERQNSTTSREIHSNISQPHIRTVSFGKTFWSDNNATISGIVIAPETPAQTFIQKFDETQLLMTDSTAPLVYITEKQHTAEAVASFSEISENPGDYSGSVVSFESNIHMNTISTKRTVESVTGTPLPPVDTILHGGVSWDSTPTDHTALLPVIGASSASQQSIVDTQHGTYEVTGRVVSAEHIEGDLSGGHALIIYDLSNTGTIDGNLGDGSIEQRTELISDLLKTQTNTDPSEKEDEQQKLHAEFTVDSADFTPHTEIEFNASKSTPADEIEEYSWEFGDGASATGKTVSHAYDAVGEYTVSLTVSNDAYHQNTSTITIGEDETVGEEPPADRYANDNGVVELEGVFKAVVEYRTGVIDIGLMLDVLTRYTTGSPTQSTL